MTRFSFACRTLVLSTVLSATATAKKTDTGAKKTGSGAKKTDSGARKSSKAGKNKKPKTDPLEDLYGGGAGGYGGGYGGGGGGYGGGGGGYGGGGADAYGDIFKAETNCPVFKCPAGKVPVQKGFSAKKQWPVVYGCDASSFDMMTMMDASSLGMPKKGGTRDKLMKCCIGRDIGLQVCGRTKKDIEEEYNKCVDKKCLGDKNCKMNAQFGIMMSGGVSGDKCDEYTKFQKANCDCVDGDSKDDTFKKSLTNFYTTFAKEKLPEKEMDDQWMSETVYKSFKKGQESKIWHALLNKYSKNLRHETKDKPRYDDYLGKGGLKDDYLNDDYLGRGGKDDYLGKDDSYGDDDYLSGMYDDLGRKRKDASGSTKGSTKGTTTSGSSSSGNKNTKGAAGAKGSEKTSSQKDEKPSSSKSASPEDKEESSKKTASSTSREKKEEEPSRRTVETIDDEPAGFGGSGDEDVEDVEL